MNRPALIPVTCAQFRPARLSFCAGVEKMARVALYGVDADGEVNAGISFEAIAEFDSFEAAARAIREANAVVASFWTSRRERA